MSPGPAVAGISAAIGFLLGGVLADGISTVLGLVALLTGLSAAAAREAAILAGRGESAVKRATAFGFYVGVTLSVFVLFIDAVWG